MTDRVIIEGLEIPCVIGAWEWERHITQKVVVDLRMDTDTRPAGASDALDDALNYAAVAERVQAFVVETEAVLIERLAEGIAALVLAEFGVSRVFVRVAKPCAVRAARTVAIEIERSAQ